MNPKFTINPKSSPTINNSLLSDSVNAVWRVFSVTQTHLFHTRHVCLYKNLTEKWSHLQYSKSYGKDGNLSENRFGEKDLV